MPKSIHFAQIVQKSTSKRENSSSIQSKHDLHENRVGSGHNNQMIALIMYNNYGNPIIGHFSIC